MRSAEADRKATCAFADRVACLSIAQYRAACPMELQEAYKQTVLAAFLIEDRLENLQVVALGVGTKTASRQKTFADSSRHPGSVDSRMRLIDCHAEVLAHRALKRFFLEEAQKALTQVVIFYGYVYCLTSCPDLNLQGGFSHVSDPSSTPPSSPSIFQTVALGDDMTSLKCLALREGIRVHFYSSSQPWYPHMVLLQHLPGNSLTPSRNAPYHTFFSPVFATVAMLLLRNGRRVDGSYRGQTCRRRGFLTTPRCILASMHSRRSKVRQLRCVSAI